MYKEDGTLPGYFEVVTGLRDRAALLAEDLIEETLEYPDYPPKRVHRGEPSNFGGLFPALCFTRFRWLDDRQLSDEDMLPGVVEGQVLCYQPTLRAGAEFGARAGPSSPGSAPSSSKDPRLVSEEITLRVSSTWLSRLSGDTTLSGLCAGVRMVGAESGEADRFGNPFLDEKSNILWAHQMTLRFELM